MYFSIIIPVYNISSYLKECIDSILSQDFNDYEVLLIDDGSTDISGKICDEYRNNYPDKIKVIHQKNGGLSYARNVGIENSNGKYIIFVDGDDYIESNSLSKFYEKLEGKDVDILITRLIEKFDGNDNETKYLDKNLDFSVLDTCSKEEVIKLIFQVSESTWPSVRYIVNRKFINDFNLRFKVGLYHEDIDWTPRLFLHASSFASCDSYWYYHRMQRVGSINTTPNPKKVLDVLTTMSFHIENKMYDSLTNESKLIIYKRLARSIYPSLKKYLLFSNNDKKDIRLFIKENKFILRYAQKKNHKFFNLVCKIFGFRVGLSLTRFM